MDEREFIKVLQKQAKEQSKLLEELPFPKFFAIVTTWLSDHPWRYLIPLAFLLTLLMKNLLGSHFTEMILALFY